MAAPTIAIAAAAKVNLYLHVTGRRDDGYHQLDSLVAFAAIHDTLLLTPSPRIELILGGQCGENHRRDASQVQRCSSMVWEIFMATSRGQALRCPEKNVRPMGRSARGVIGIRIADNDVVVEMDSLKSTKSTILTVTQRGYAKRTEVGDYRLQGRSGSGIINLKVTERTGPVVQVMEVGNEDQVMVITEHGKIIRTSVKDISILGRPTQGVRLINLKEGDAVVAVAHIAESDEVEGATPPESGAPQAPHPG